MLEIKRSYVSPKLTAHGALTAITGIEVFKTTPGTDDILGAGHFEPGNGNGDDNGNGNGNGNG